MHGIHDDFLLCQWIDSYRVIDNDSAAGHYGVADSYGAADHYGVAESPPSGLRARQWFSNWQKR